MRIHRNAKTTPAARAALVHRVLHEDWTYAETATAFAVSERTVAKWVPPVPRRRRRGPGRRVVAVRRSRPTLKGNRSIRISAIPSARRASSVNAINLTTIVVVSDTGSPTPKTFRASVNGAKGGVPITLSSLITQSRVRHRCLMIPHQQPVEGYPLARLRFAQYAFIRLPIAAFSAALHWCRFCVAFDFRVALGLALG